MNIKKLSRYIINLGFLALGIWLSWLFLQRPETTQALEKIKTANWGPLVWIGLASITVYIFRSLRWRQLLSASGFDVPLSWCLTSLSVGYLVSFGLPRFGEIIRCYILKKKNLADMAPSLGTVVAERVVDILMLLLMMVLTLLLQLNKVYLFFRDSIFQPLEEKWGNQFPIYIAIIGLVGLLMLVFIIKYFRKNKLVSGFAIGLKSIFKLQRPWLFIIYTVGIWLCYYLMTWLWFFLFPETSGLGLLAGLTIFTIGTVGRSVPIQGGGMGAYHFLVGQALILYGASPVFGATLAILIHGGQSVFTFLMGIPALIYIVVAKGADRNS